MSGRNADNDTAVEAQRAFFGRRKGHKLRAHQAELIADLLRGPALHLSRTWSRSFHRGWRRPRMTPVPVRTE